MHAELQAEENQKEKGLIVRSSASSPVNYLACIAQEIPKVAVRGNSLSTSKKSVALSYLRLCQVDFCQPSLSGIHICSLLRLWGF